MATIHGPSQIMQLCARLPTLLPPQPTKDMVERHPALPREPDTPTAQALHLRRKTPVTPALVPFDWYGCPAGLRER
jgi:hypothetical protein